MLTAQVAAPKQYSSHGSTLQRVIQFEIERRRYTFPSKAVKGLNFEKLMSAVPGRLPEPFRRLDLAQQSMKIGLIVVSFYYLTLVSEACIILVLYHFTTQLYFS